MRIIHFSIPALVPYLPRYAILSLLLLSTIACSTIELDDRGLAILYEEQLVFVPLASDLQSLPREEEMIRERINNGFEQLQNGSSFFTVVESAQPLPLLNVDAQMTAPYTITGRLEKNDAGLMGNIALRFKSRDFESICISTVSSIDENGAYLRSTQFWYNSGSVSWQAGTDYEVNNCALFVIMAVSSPYDVIEPPLNYMALSRTLGYEYIDGVLAEVYEVRQQGGEYEEEIETWSTTRVWLDAETGLPIKSTQQPNAIEVKYKLLDDLTIEPPCVGSC